MAALARMTFEGVDVQPLWGQLVERATTDPTDAAALMDAATLLLLSGNRDGGLGIQAQALDQNRLYRRPAAGEAGLRLLALAVAGDTMANTPLDFLLEGSDIELMTLYVDPGHLPTDPCPTTTWRSWPSASPRPIGQASRPWRRFCLIGRDRA